METTKYVCAACGNEFEECITLRSDVGEYSGCPHCGCWDFKEETRVTLSKKQLKQYVHLVRETAQMEAELSALEKKGEENRELYEMYQNNKMRCMALTMKIHTFIFNIDDSLMRQILEARYIKGMSWAAISMRVGGYYSGDYLRILHDRYLKNTD